MDIKQLRAFLTIAETHNISKAAPMLNIVQSAVSRQIQLLEDELGVTLFERSKHGMQLTNEGKILEGYARRIIREIEAAKMELSSKTGILEGSVNIGIISSLSEELSVAIMRVIKNKYPKINLKITVAYSGYLKEWLESGDIDLALTYHSTSSKFIESKKIISEQLCLISPPVAKLTSKQYDLTNISTLPLILPYAPHRLRSLVEQAFSREKLHFSVSTEVNDLAIQKQLVKENFGYTILPLVSIKNDLQQNSLKAAPIDHPDFTRSIALALSTTRPISRLVHVVANEVMNFSKEAVKTEEWLGGQWIGE